MESPVIPVSTAIVTLVATPLRLDRVAVPEVGVDRHSHRVGHEPEMVQHRVQSDLGVPATQRPGQAGARRGQRFEPRRQQLVPAPLAF
jgi:hypothetical protein